MDLVTDQGSTRIAWVLQTLQDVPADDDWLSPTEKSILERFRIPKRRQDWRLGRWTAKAALSTLTDAMGPVSPTSLEIMAGPEGAPQVSIDGRLATVSISISHSDGIGLAAVGPSHLGLGCDAESVEERSAAFVTDYFTQAETACIDAAASSDRDVLITLLWSAKESALKALRTGLRADTRSVEVTLPRGTGGGHPAAGCWAALTVGPRPLWGWWRRHGRHVLTVVADVPTAFPRRLEIQPVPYASSYAR